MARSDGCPPAIRADFIFKHTDDRMSPKHSLRTSAGLIMAAVLATSSAVNAQSFNAGPFGVETTHQFAIGAAVRMQDRDNRIVGKTNIDGQQNLCSADDCVSSSGDTAPNQRFVDAAGFYSVNGDDGNLNYDQHDLIGAAAKLTSDFLFDFGWGITGFARTLAFFDQANTNFDNFHPNTIYQPQRTPRSAAAEELIGTNIDLLDAYINFYAPIPFTDSEVAIKIGKQVLNWGESTVLVPNSINTISPPNLPRLRLVGSDLKEVFEPVPLAVVNFPVADLFNIEAFYQWKWEPVVVDPVGSYFSTSDIAGGGEYAMLSFGKAPEDPDSMSTPAGLTGLLSSSSRTVNRIDDVLPSDSGQYGISARMFLEDFMNGTELAFYHVNYHSRFPIASFVAADFSDCRDDVGGIPLPPLPIPGVDPRALACTGLANDPAASLAAIGGFLAGNPQPFPGEALPVDTAKLFFEYPEDIRLYGVSFNNTIGDIGLQGEIAFRDNLPVQVSQSDLVFASLQPAFPEEDISILGLATIPGNRNAVPDYVETRYRGNTVTPGDRIHGYERMKVAQANLGGTMTFGAGSNPIGASQILAIFELGYVHVFDMPSLDEIQFNGPGTDTHYSPGADGTGSNGEGDARRQNPTRQTDGFVTEGSWGYRILSFINYDNVFAGVNVAPLIGIFHDVEGYSPGPGGLFVEGSKQFIGGLRFDYLSRYGAELRYTWYTGGGEHNQLRDRDFAQLSFNLSF